jgi:hypothetical protein
MNRELLEQMTKEELLELASRQNDAINSLDEQRYNASAVIDHLVSATHELHNLRYHDGERLVVQDRLDDWVREMYMKHPLYLVSAEYPDTTSKEEESEEKLPTRSDVILNLASMRDKARMNGYDGYVKTLNRAIELLAEEVDE